jgi:hypothetical protein
MADPTARGIISPKIIQLSVFLENRVGLLLKISKQLENENVHICAISIIDTADSAIIRMIVDNVPAAKKAFQARGLTVYESDLIGVQVPIAQGIGVTSILGTLLRAEINVHYVYSLITRHDGNPILAFHVDNREAATKILQNHDLEMVGQDDIQWEGSEGS